MKTNLEWYPHRKDSHRHPKFKLLRTLYGSGDLGWAMEGRFWALNNLIADSSECKLDISKTRNKAVVAEELGLPLTELETFISRLISPDVELLFEVEPGIYTTKKIADALENTLSERERSRTKKGKGKKTEGNDESTEELSKSTGELLYRVKESKVKESRREESKVKESESSPEPPETPTTTFESFSSPTPTEETEDLTQKPEAKKGKIEKLCTPVDFESDEQIRAAIILMLARYCKVTTPEKAEISRFFNIITKTAGCTRKTAHKITLECFSGYKELDQDRQNLPYLSVQITGKINDAIIKAREERAKNEKHIEAAENKTFAEKFTKPETIPKGAKGMMDGINY